MRGELAGETVSQTHIDAQRHWQKMQGKEKGTALKRGQGNSRDRETTCKQ